MKTYYFKGILQKSGWFKNTGIRVDNLGVITDLFTFNPKNTSIDIINGYALPGFQNAHSHAFQYAMAGLAEKHEKVNKQDDFWGWREAMYQLALSINPDQMEAIATMLYTEMARHGYTNVTEFHYLHHDKSGKPYSNLAEMGSRLISAAKTAGIGITLVPIFYNKGNFGVEPNNRQRRFISTSIDEYLKLFNASEAACKHYEHANVAIGVHSMRGVDPYDIVEIANNGPKNIPFHLHVSEQLQEVEDAKIFLGKRPVEWLLNHIDLNDRFHLVHATHLTDQEISGIAESKANVVLCPTTEGNLGDGIFPLRKYQEKGGKWSIGTDSHIGLNPFEELRLLDYGQRLISHKRNTFLSDNKNDSGTNALEMAVLTGRKAMGNYSSEFFTIGDSLNACVIDASAPLIATSSEKNLTSTIVYSTDSLFQSETISHGNRIVSSNMHQNKYGIAKGFIETLNQLKNR
ncbi:formimidoylglutamate deiminase [Saonia flava]|uniref:Formimidoylglutamate deiminase n=1 Tax=Saonia flava TaxID=523696 RepID=A0A846QSE1_9FLAO|nr:formimidoylglutamate deiminase [Saonia flava]NJB71071.1 formimidoylglutamate deiminase [Saonia flava]